jgi:MFS family permease
MEKQKGQLFLHLMSVFIGFISLSMALPIYPKLFLVQNPTFLGATIFYGLAISMYPLGQLLSAPIFGRLSDSVGRKKMLLISIFLSVLMFFQTYFAINTQHLALFLVSRFLTGCFYHTFTISQASISDLSIKEEKAKRFGLLYALVSIAFIIGPLLSKGFNSLSKPFLVLSLLNCALGLIIWPFLKETVGKSRPFFRINFSVISRIRPYLFINFFLYLGLFTYFGFYTPFFIEQIEITYLISISAFFTAFTQLFLLKPLLKRYSEMTLLSAASLCFAIFLSLATLYSQVVFIYLAASCIGILLPISSSIIANMLTKETTGEGLGLNRSLQLFSETCGKILGGYLGLFSIKSPLYFASLMLIFGSLLLYSKKGLAKQF